MSKVCSTRAEQVLAAVKGQFAAYFEPILREDGSVLAEGWPEPVLIDRGDRWEVVWEEGPDEWPFTLDGGSSEEERVLMAAAAAEFGVAVKPGQIAKACERKPAKMPPGVFVEPVNHVSVGIYPA